MNRKIERLLILFRTLSAIVFFHVCATCAFFCFNVTLVQPNAEAYWYRLSLAFAVATIGCGWIVNRLGSKADFICGFENLLKFYGYPMIPMVLLPLILIGDGRPLGAGPMDTRQALALFLSFFGYIGALSIMSLVVLLPDRRKAMSSL